MHSASDDRFDDDHDQHAHHVRGRHVPGDAFPARRARKSSTRPSRGAADDRKTLQLCKQAANALGEALMEFELAMVEGDSADALDDALSPAIDIDDADAVATDELPPPPDVSLYVDSVEPYPNASRLRVTVVATTDDAEELARLREHVAAAQPFLRSALAGAISRRRVPELVLVVVPENAGASNDGDDEDDAEE